MEGYGHPYHQAMGGGEAAAVAAGDRFPQWTGVETMEFLAVRAELDRAFMETKRNKALWEVMAARLKEKGFNRTAEQCKSKWKNLVTRYKGCETMEPEAMRQQFPYYNELHAIFSARLHHMVWAEAEGSGAAASSVPTRSAVGGKGKALAMTSEQVSSDEEEDDVEEREYEYEEEYVEKRKNVGTRKGSERKKQKKGEKGESEVGELAKVVERFMKEREEADERWREACEAREEERRGREEMWRKTMAALEEERRAMERHWREREEQRRVREEARATRRDALINHLLNRLRRDDNM